MLATNHHFALPEAVAQRMAAPPKAMIAKAPSTKYHDLTLKMVAQAAIQVRKYSMIKGHEAVWRLNHSP